MKKHILIVDDEAVIRELLTEFLTFNQYRVTAVASAMEAKETVRTDVPDLVISDLQLEDSDGLEMIEQLKTAHKDLPVILLTGVLFDPHVIQGAISKKVSSYLPKTSPLAQVLAEVKRLVGG